MDKVLATYLNGSVLLDEPVGWPNGTRVELMPTAGESRAQSEVEVLRRVWGNEDSYGLDESVWPTTREGIDFLLAHMDAAEPLELSPEEAEMLEKEQEANKKLQKELMRKSWEEVERLF